MPRKLCVIAIAGVCCAVLGALVLAAPAPATKPAPIVTIKKTDGTTVRGQLVSPEPDLVIVKAPGAAGETTSVRGRRSSRSAMA